MKRKLFFSALITAMSLNAFGQTQTISFETSEGYTLGDINNQNGWIYWGGLDANTGTVVNTTATVGTNSLNFISNGYMDEAGAEKTVTAYPKTEYSFDYKIEAIDGSDYSMAVWDTSYNTVASFSVNYIAGNLRIFDGSTGLLSNTTTNLTPGVWYNLKMIVDIPAMTVEYFVNNTSLGVKSVPTDATGFNIIDFYYDDFDTGYTVDNIKISNANSLSTNDIEVDKAFTISPNPTLDFLNIKINDKINSVEIFDMSGKLALKDNSGKEQINVKILQSGNYIVKINTSKGIVSKRIIKK